MIRLSSYTQLCICLSCFKFLFLKSYVSTDFDVHRNWMAITYNLPMKEWYYDETSQWTLDYPPLFALFEFFLALVASLLNLKDALELTEESLIRTESVIAYQKTTVIISDFIYYYAVYKLCLALNPLFLKNGDRSSKVKPTQIKNGDQQKKSNKKSHDKDQPQGIVDALCRPNPTSGIALLLLLHPSLLMIDHIHFQYNGFLTGVLLLSIANVVAGRYYIGAFWFAVLLNLKHIYLYYAPAVGLFFLTSYVFGKTQGQNIVLSSLTKSIKLALVVILVFATTYTPYADINALKQIGSRLFPFRRGLTHAFWAPNFWCLYNLADKVLATIFKDSLVVKFDLESISSKKVVSSTSGLVQEYKHQYLPSIEPIVTFFLVGIFLIPMIVKQITLIGLRSHRVFLKSLVLAAFTAFMFGWHVHEKAILLVVIPMVAVSFIDPKMTNAFMRLSLAGTYSLFPLLYQPAEYLVKSTLLIGYYTYSNYMTSSYCKSLSARSHQQKRVTRWRLATLCSKLFFLIDKLFVLALILNEVYVSLLHNRLNCDWSPIAKLNRLEFLPLMMISSISAIGVVVSYLEIYYDFVFGTEEAPAPTGAADEVVDDA